LRAYLPLGSSLSWIKPVNVKSITIQNAVSSEPTHTILQCITSAQPVGAGACEPAPTALSLHGINIGSLPLHD